MKRSKRLERVSDSIWPLKLSTAISVNLILMRRSVVPPVNRNNKIKRLHCDQMVMLLTFLTEHY